jgi:hypothetical protein
MANKALAKRQKLSFRVEPSQQAPRGRAAVRSAPLQPQRSTPAGKLQPQRALRGKGSSDGQ